MEKQTPIYWFKLHCDGSFDSQELYGGIRFPIEIVMEFAWLMDVGRYIREGSSWTNELQAVKVGVILSMGEAVHFI